MIDQVELLLRVHHVNLVSLVGYCFEVDHLALVYDYTASGDLKQHLSDIYYIEVIYTLRLKKIPGHISMLHMLI